MGEWKTVRFGELAAPEARSFSVGPFGSAITKENYVPSGVPVVRGVNLARGRFFDDDFVFVSDQKADELAYANLKPADLVFTHRGTLGQVSMIPRRPRFARYILSSSQVKARLDVSRALPEFYYYWFRSSFGQESLLSNASTVGVPGIASPLATIKSLAVPLPPHGEQQAIAAVLGALDDKIAVNERIAGTVLDLANAAYLSCVSGAFESVLVGDVMELKYGKSLPAARRVDGDVPVFGSGGVSGRHNEPLVEGPGVIVGRKGTVGSVYWSERSFFPIDTTFYVKIKRADIPMEFAYFALSNMGLDVMNSDSAVPGLNRNNVHGLPLKLPVGESVRQFGDQVRSMFELRESVYAENQTLAQLRDTLLPKLMSGELRVRDAEKMVEDAT